MSKNSEGPPLKNLRAKNIQNLARFYTTSDFDREYLRNETRYPTSERYVIENDFSRVLQNKSGELWSTIQKVVHVRLDPPKSIFQAPEIFTRARRWPRLASTHHKLGPGPPKNLKGEHLKLRLKFHICASITSWVVGVTS